MSTPRFLGMASLKKYKLKILKYYSVQKDGRHSNMTILCLLITFKIIHTEELFWCFIYRHTEFKSETSKQYIVCKMAAILTLKTIKKYLLYSLSSGFVPCSAIQV